MKKLKEELKYGKKGITLISLVVTIIVLLILAGVTIATLTGENGILTRASEAKEKTEEAQEKEGLELAVTSSQMEDVNTLEITEEKLSDAIKQQFGNNKDFSITDNGDGSFLVSMNDTQRMYYIDETGKIIDQSKMLKISTADELKAFKDDVNSGNTYEDWYVYLANDITLDINELWVPIGLYLNENSSPDNESNIPFSGIFDGKNHSVDGIYINTTNKVQGLFGLIDSGKVINLNIGENCNITGGSATAAIVGYAYNNSVISNCSNNANINSAYGAGIVGCAYVNTIITNSHNAGRINGTSKFTGGVAGYVAQDSIIKECYNVGEVTGIKHVGGVVGDINLNSNAVNCYNTGIVNGENMVGGITGYLGENSAINNCYTTGDVEAQYHVGGICGYTSVNTLISQCYNEGDIKAIGQNESGNSNVGGLVGLTESNIMNCYNTGAVTGLYECVGGLIGLNRGTLENSYNVGNVNGEIEKKGSLVGNNDEFYYTEDDRTYIGKIYNSYSLENVTTDLCGVNNSILGNECSFKTSLELQSLYVTLGNSFKEDKNNINNGYPILQWQ